MTHKIGAFTTTFDEVDWIRAQAPQLAVFDHVVIVCADRPLVWVDPDNAEPPPPTEALQAICDEWGFEMVPFERPKDNPPSVLGLQRRLGVETLKAAGCVATHWSAPDEMYTVADTQVIKQSLTLAPDRILSAPSFPLWWNTEWYVSYYPVMCGFSTDFDPWLYDAGAHHKIAEKYKKWYRCNEKYTAYANPEALVKTQSFENPPLPGRDVICWHFAWARPEEEMRRKLYSWGHADAQHSPLHWKWWDEWVPGKGMYWPSKDVPAVRVPLDLPDELKTRMAHILPRLRSTP